MGSKCRHCRRRLTWAQCRKQYGRLMRRGLPEVEAKAMLPGCQKCITKVLKDRKTRTDGDTPKRERETT